MPNTYKLINNADGLEQLIINGKESFLVTKDSEPAVLKLLSDIDKIKSIHNTTIELINSMVSSSNSHTINLLKLANLNK